MRSRSPKRVAIRSRGVALALVGLGVSCSGGEPRAGRASDPARSTAGIDGSPGAQRIVSLIPAATEILFALGAGDRLVGRTRWGVHPPEAIGIPDVGDGVRPSLEAVLARDPDLVVLFEGTDTEGVERRLTGLGISVLSLRHNTLPDLERNVVLLGDAVACSAAADELNDRIQGDLETVTLALGGSPPVRVYYDVWADPPMTIGRGSFLDSLLTIAGGANVFGDLDTPAPEIGLETIVQRDPDIVIHPVTRLEGVVEPAPAERRSWRVIPAIAEGRVVHVDADLLGRLGPRVGDAARELAGALRPDLAIPPADEAPLAARCGE